jgi:hypothetical protein
MTVSKGVVRVCEHYGALEGVVETRRYEGVEGGVVS